MKSTDFLSEDIASDAHEMHLDHEVQMARKDCYTAADDAIALHKLLRNVSEQQGLEGWVAAKITLASDYLKTVREHLEYQLMSQVPAETMELPLAEGLADEFMAMAKAKGMNARIAGTPDEERARTDAMLKQRAADRAAAPAPAGPDAEERAKLQAKLKELEAKFDPNFEYSDDHSFWTEQNSISKQINAIKQRLSQNVSETSAGSVAGVVNPTPKNKAKVGTLFGGTYKQKKTKA